MKSRESNDSDQNQSREAYAWALYDWANSAFATTVIAGFFPIFFKKAWAPELSSGESTFALGVTNSSIALSMIILAPLIGTIGDITQKRKSLLFLFTIIGCAASAGLAFVNSGAWPISLFIFYLANIGFMGSLVFYDSLLPSVANGRAHWISGLGYSLGYLGGGLLFAVQVYAVTRPEVFLQTGPGPIIRMSFVQVGAWWLLFSLPLFYYVKEPKPNLNVNKTNFTSLLNELKQTLLLISKNSSLLWFLLAYILYIDGVNTTVKMAVDYGLSLGFSQNDLIGALLLVQFIGFPSALGWGWLAGRLGARESIYICIGVYMLTVIGAYFMTSSQHFYLLATSIGLVQGGIQAVSRSFFTELVPVDKTAEYFGIYNMVGKFSAILGPTAIGLISVLTGNSRLSILSLLVFFAAGAYLLGKVPAKQLTTTG